MSLGARDPHTGIRTTGHEWAGITELDTPIPRVVIVCYILTFAVAVGMWVLLPSWPTPGGVTPGLLGVTQRDTVEGQLAEAAERRSGMVQRIMALDLDGQGDDPEARAFAVKSGATLFADNCAACHGHDAAGGPGFPSLRDGAWLWGGSAASILETLRVGINADHEESRFAQMPAFGRDQLLSRDEVLTLVDYLRHKADLGAAEDVDPAAGAALFAESCSACHGEDGKGDQTLGAPNLTDGSWIYGGEREAIYRTLMRGRQGHMPSWSGRLTPSQLRILALYVESLGRS